MGGDYEGFVTTTSKEEQIAGCSTGCVYSGRYVGWEVRGDRAIHKSTYRACIMVAPLSKVPSPMPHAFPFPSATVSMETGVSLQRIRPAGAIPC